MMKLLFYNADLSAWDDFVLAADYLKIERHRGMDELQVVAPDEWLEFRLMPALFCQVIEDGRITMWVLDRSSVSAEKEDIPKVTFTLYEPLWLLNMRACLRHDFSEAGLEEFTTAVITENTEGERGLGDIDLSALTELPDADSITMVVDGESLADLLAEVYGDQGLKLYMAVDMTDGLKLTAGVQHAVFAEGKILSPLLRNMKVSLAKATNEFGTVYVSGEYQPASGAGGDDGPIVMRGYFTFGNEGLFREEHFTASQKSSEGMTQLSYQGFLDAEAERIAKRRIIDLDISATEGVFDNVEASGRYNRAGVIFPVSIYGKLYRYIVDEVKATPKETSIGVSEYKE